jgi:hypothetical protein
METKAWFGAAILLVLFAGIFGSTTPPEKAASPAQVRYTLLRQEVITDIQTQQSEPATSIQVIHLANRDGRGLALWLLRILSISETSASGVFSTRREAAVRLVRC